MSEKLRLNNFTETQLCELEAPIATASYTPISHKEIIETIKEELDKKGFAINTANYKANHAGTQLIGYYGIKHIDAEIDIMLAFRNSYNKTISAGVAIGGVVVICENGMVAGDVSLIRKHTGNASIVVKNKIRAGINRFDISFKEVLADRDQMKKQLITKQACAEILGRMYIQEKIITGTQLDIIKNELDYSKHFKTETVWDFYNHCTESLKTSSVYDWMPNHINLHNFIKKELI